MALPKTETRKIRHPNRKLKMQIEQQSLALNAQLTTAYQTYLTNLELIDLEEKMKLSPNKISILP
jgi:hypothetical protein